MSHDYLSSVILLEVDAASVAVLKFERDAPRSIHMDRIARWVEASQGMEIETGDVHFFRPHGDIQAIQATKNAPVHLRVDLSGPPSLPKLGKTLALEAPDHNAAM
jgi:hypothetical protein